jgi:hypothetical protein
MTLTLLESEDGKNPWANVDINRFSKKGLAALNALAQSDHLPTSNASSWIWPPSSTSSRPPPVTLHQEPAPQPLAGSSAQPCRHPDCGYPCNRKCNHKCNQLSRCKPVTWNAGYTVTHFST